MFVNLWITPKGETAARLRGERSLCSRPPRVPINSRRVSTLPIFQSSRQGEQQSVAGTTDPRAVDSCDAGGGLLCEGCAT